MSSGNKLHIDMQTTSLMKFHVHGRHRPKEVIVLHETISGDIVGLDDIKQTIGYLAAKDYGIHGMTDKEGYIAWALGLGDAIFWQAGGVNTYSIGIEQVSDIPEMPEEERAAAWEARTKQLNATAKLCACICRAWKIPVQYSDGDHPGITSHWDVSQHHPESEGHWDCWPIHKGGHYPILEVVQLAKNFYEDGWHF